MLGTQQTEQPVALRLIDIETEKDSSEASWEQQQQAQQTQQTQQRHQGQVDAQLMKEQDKFNDNTNLDTQEEGMLTEHSTIDIREAKDLYLGLELD